MTSYNPTIIVNTMANNPTIQEQAQLIHQTIDQIGWSSDNPSALVERIRRLQIGLPMEDQFAALILWLGQCKLVHKLDQHQYPNNSKDYVRVPDLLTVFQVDGKQYSTVVEVKSTDKNSLGWRPDYYNALLEYGRCLGLPVLVACYWKKMHLWTFNDLSTMRIARKNYHLSCETAIKESLLSLLAGDFMLVLKPGVGFHVVMKKIALSEIQEDGAEKWILEVKDAYYTSELGTKSKLPSVIRRLLFYFPLIENVIADDGDHIHISYIVDQGENSMWAQQAIHSYTEENALSWRDVPKKYGFHFGESFFLRGSLDGLEHQVTQYVLHARPHNYPIWLDIPTES